MKWRIYRLGRLKISLNELRSWHAGEYCGHGMTLVVHAVYWNGVEKFSVIRQIDSEYRKPWASNADRLKEI